MSSSIPLRVCFLTGRGEIADWMVASVRRMVRTTNAEISLVVHATKPDDTADDPSIWDQLKRFCCARVQDVKSIVRRDPQTYTSMAAVDCLASADHIRCEAKPAKRFGVVIPSDVVESIADTCDVVVHFKAGILQGDILTRPKYGVLSFHHGDIRRYRGTPAGFWEFIHNAPRGGVTLQRLTSKLDAGYIVTFKSVDLSDAHTWAEIRRRLFRCSPDALATGIRKLQDPAFDPSSVPKEELGTLYYMSEITFRIQMIYFLKEIRGLLRA